MSYRWVDHTAELELAIAGSTPEAIYLDALAALAELLGDDAGGEPLRLEVAVQGSDPALLLAEWLDEFVYRAETEGFVPEVVENLKLDGAGLTARIRGRRGNPPHLVKGVTHHRLSFEVNPRGVRATVVLDV